MGGRRNREQDKKHEEEGEEEEKVEGEGEGERETHGTEAEKFREGSTFTSMLIQWPFLTVEMFCQGKRRKQT